jgi:predicted  nucleic acid-binding Zn-ribbon protein
MTQIHQLYQLQQIDTEIREKKQRLGEVLKAQKGSKALLAARERAETAAAEHQSWQTKHQALNLELSSLNTKTKNSENRLYSGKVTNPKELSDLQNEIDSLNRRRAVLEDEILEAMVMVEDAETEKADADEALAEIEARWEETMVSLKQEQNELALRLHKLTGAREERASVIDAALLEEYEKLKLSKGGVAVVKLRVKACMGCQLTVSAVKVKEAQRGRKVYCGGCGRILYPL